MKHIKKFLETAESLNTEVNDNSIVVTVENSTVIITKFGDKKELAIKKKENDIIDSYKIKDIVEEFRQNGGQIGLNEDDVDEISRILFTYVVDKDENIEKIFTLFW
jgi:ribosome-interacting GTPase 1